MAVLDLKSNLIGHLLRVADLYCASTASTHASVSKQLFGRGGHIDELRQGKRDLGTATFERSMEWLAAHWPADAIWPEDIARPTVQDDADRAPVAGPVSAGPALSEVVT